MHYSIQSDHAHLIVEAKDVKALGRLMMSIGARFSRAVNRVFGQAGRVLADTYHFRALTTPREVRNALRYVLLNAARHLGRPSRTGEPDRASSGRWFEGWKGRVAAARDAPGVAAARAWLLREGWLVHGRIDLRDIPGKAKRKRRAEAPARL